MNISLDEWGIWASEVDVADLESRRRHRRLFGGYAFGVKTTLHPGGRGDRQVEIPCTGYGIILDRKYVTSRFATASNATARGVMAKAFELAGITEDQFTLGGIEIDDVVGRGVHNISSVSDIARSVAEVTNGVPWVDPVRELQLVRRTQVEQSPIVLNGTNVKAAAISGKPRHYASRVVLIGAPQSGTSVDNFSGDSLTTEFELRFQADQILAIRVDGQDETFDGTNPVWTVDLDGGTVTRDSAPDNGEAIEVVYSTTDRLTVVRSRTPPGGLPGLDVRVEDESIDMLSAGRAKADAYLDRHNKPKRQVQIRTISGAVLYMRPGAAPVVDLPDLDLDMTRVLVERVTTTVGSEGNNDNPDVTLALQCTAGEWESLSADYWRNLVRLQNPPRPRVSQLDDPNQILISEGDVPLAMRLPVNMGGSASGGWSTTAWAQPWGAGVARINGYQLNGRTLILTLTGACLSRTALLPAQFAQVRLYDLTNSQALGNVITIDSTIPTLYAVRNIEVPLRSINVTWQGLVVGNLRSAAAWNTRLDLEGT